MDEPLFILLFCDMKVEIFDILAILYARPNQHHQIYGSEVALARVNSQSSLMPPPPDIYSTAALGQILAAALQQASVNRLGQPHWDAYFSQFFQSPNDGSRPCTSVESGKSSADNRQRPSCTACKGS
jgi:hypothetical protein